MAASINDSPLSNMRLMNNFDARGDAVSALEAISESRGEASLIHFCNDMQDTYNEFKATGHDAFMVTLHGHHNNPTWTPLDGSPQEITQHTKDRKPVALIDLHEPFPKEVILARKCFSEIKGNKPFRADLLGNQMKRNAMVVAGPLKSGLQCD